MERTPRYQLTYPTSSDEVDDAPQQFKTMCESVENALAMVDDRQTSEAVKPVVMPTLDQLETSTGVTGQTGYVTGDPDPLNDGVYHYDGAEWGKDGRARTITFDRSGLSTSADSLSITGIALAQTDGTWLGIVTLRWTNDGPFNTSPWNPIGLARMNEWRATREATGVCNENMDGEDIVKNTFGVKGDMINYLTPGSVNVPANSWHDGNIVFPIQPK